MKNPSILFSEDQMRFIQKATNATRQEVIHTIQLSRISVEEIIITIKKSAHKLLPFSGKTNHA